MSLALSVEMRNGLGGLLSAARKNDFCEQLDAIATELSHGKRMYFLFLEHTVPALTRKQF